MDPLLQSLTAIEGYHAYIIAIAVAAARMGGVMLMMPAFTRLGLSGAIRSIVALVLAVPVMPIILGDLTAANFGFVQLATILVKEAAVGMVLGLVLGIPIWAAEAAGEILDLQRGVTFAELIDPSYTGTNNILGTFFALSMLTLYFLSGGLSVTLRTVYESYTLWPLTSFMPMFNLEAGRFLLMMLDDIMGLGLMLVAPLVLAMLLADLSLALVARAAPHMNMFVLSLPVKNFALALLLVLYCAFLITYLGDNLGTLVESRVKLEQLAPKP